MSFTKFNRLPVELQWEILEVAAYSHLEEPTAHFTDFWGTTLGVTQLRLKVTSNEGLSEPLKPPGIYTALMGTCRISQAIMRRIAHMWRPRNSLSLHYMQSNTIHHYTHMHFQVPPRTWAGAASESIDASNDLIIVCRPSASAAWTTFPRVESIGALYEYDPPNHTLQWPYIASTTLGGPTALLHRFPRLRVLYILVNPQDTIERMVGPPQFTECMTDYHWAYTQTVDKVPPKKFNARQRIYYELPKAITKTMCRGLERAIHEVREASIQMR